MDIENKGPNNTVNINEPGKDHDEKQSSGGNPESGVKTEAFIKKAIIGDYEFSIYNPKLRNPAEILEKLVPLKGNERLSNDEKAECIRQIIKEYME